MIIKVEIGEQDKDDLFDRNWKMGSCFGPKQFPDRLHASSNRYEANNRYFDLCCLNPGDHVLECSNAIGPYGWGSGSIEISSQRYCDDFFGFRTFRNVRVERKYT